ncbi:MAG: hypothetical protein J0L52_09250 [Caulobacterales bacterium]|nr:hypothetical protein [Caulobacterales bacterium]
MADQRRDPFDEEMEALRTEVGRFVLQLLNADGGKSDVLRQVGDRLASHISDKARPVSALNPDDRRFLDQLSRRLERLDHDVRRLQSSRPPPVWSIEPDGSEGAEAPETGGRTYDEESPYRSWAFDDLPRWVPWGLAAILAVALTVAVVFIVINPRMAAEPAVAEGAPVVEIPNDATTRWDTVLATVETWPAEDRVAARRILCGNDNADAVCPSWEARSVALANDAAARARVAGVVSQALAQSRCPVVSQSDADSQIPTRASDLACLLEDPT